MDGPRWYYIKWNKSDRERQIPYDFPCVESKKQNKIANITKQKQNQRYREQTGSYQREGVGGWEKQVREIKWYKLPVTKRMSHGYEKHSMGNIVNNNVISLYGNR